jgi:ABC-type transporter MlaC component
MNGRAAGEINRRVFLGLAAALLAGTPLSAEAATGPESYVTEITDKVLQLANTGTKGPALRARFASLMNRYINLRGVADYALGPYRKKLPSGRASEFYGLVSNYAAALFVYYLEDFQGSGLEIKSTSNRGKLTEIRSAIVLKRGGREQVRWRLQQAGSGYRITDVNLKGVWLTIAMRDRFTKVLNRSKGDFDPLFAELKEANTW